jgi:hypothetical protein
MMEIVFAIHHAATWSLVGLIWTIQLVHYPLFSEVGSAGFVAYHRQHTRRITWVVAPLMFAELVTTGVLLFWGSRELWLLASLVPLGFNWVSTALVQIPLHNQLALGFDLSVHRKLVATNWWRTIAWSLRGVCLLVGWLG